MSPAALFLLLTLCAASGQSALNQPAQARLLFEQKKYADAAAILEGIQQRGTLPPSDLVLLGMCYTELQQLDKAGRVLDLAALVAPQSVPLLSARGNLAFAKKKYADAVVVFREAHALDSADRSAVAGLVASLCNSGVELFGQGRFDVARKEFLEAVQLDPQSVPALRNMGILELEKGDPAVSAEYLERGLAISPGDIELLKLLFLARNRQGDTAAMLPILDRLILALPADPEPYAVKGRLLEQQGRTLEAAEMFRRAVDRGTQDPLPYLRIGSTEHSRASLTDAIGKAVHLISSLQIQASQAMGNARKPEDLRGAKLITAKVEDVRATLQSSLALFREIDGDTLFERDLSLLQSWYPGSVDLAASLGRLYQEKERWRDSLTAWQHILKDHPVDRDAQAGSGLAFEKLGDVEQAILAYRRAREVEPESADIYAALERVYAGREGDLRQILLDISLRETRNAVLVRELAKLEAGLGLQGDADKHLGRAAEIESGK